MPKFYLAIESATKVCSVAVFKEDSLLHIEEASGDYSHAEKLAPFVELCLKACGLKTSDLACVAISSGPGSYTGLRIGLSLAKGICFASEIPLISISTLTAMAAGASQFSNDREALYMPMIDARRMEVYTALFNFDLEVVQDVSAKILDDESLRELPTNKKILIFGDGSEKCKTVWNDQNLSYLDESFISTRYWGHLIHDKFQKNNFEDLAYYEPFYFKSFKAIKPKSML